MSIVSNVLHYGPNFRIGRDGAKVVRAMAAGDVVGAFVYWEWSGRLPVTASSLAPAVRHAPGESASCVLAEREPGSNVQLLRARRPIAADGPITVDYWRLPFWVWWPPAVVPPALCRPAVYAVSAVGVVHGVGIVAAVALGAGAAVGAAIERRYWRLVPVITRDLGRYINHSSRPSAHLVWRGADAIVVVRRALRAGDEITLDYAALPSYCARPGPTFAH